MGKPKTKRPKSDPPVPAATPVDPGTVEDAPSLRRTSTNAPVVLGRTHVSGLRPPTLNANERDLSGVLGDMEASDWDPTTNGGIGPLSDVGLMTHGQRSHVLGKFKLIRKLGVGGFGAVYLARQVDTGQEMALKVLARSMANRPDFLHRFYREARTLSRLEHPNIVRGYEPFEAEGWHCFAMEYLDGESMQTWLRRLGRLKVGDALHIALCVSSALHYAHELGLVHRDIKPENILLTRQGQVKVADLGLAKAVDEDLSLTRSGTGFGTPHYMAPEQARNAKHADTRSDIYALGSSLYHFVTGQLPFKGDTALELILSKEQSALPEMRKFNPEVTEQLDLLVYKMLAKNINHRYQTVAELIRDMQRLGLASARLSFMDEVMDSESDVCTPPPTAITRPVVIEVQSPAPPASTLRPDDHWWNVRFVNSKQQRVTRRMTTRQVQELVLDPKFDMKAEVSPDEGVEYQPLVHYGEFQHSMLRRQSKIAKTSAADSGTQLQKLYEDEQARRRLEEEIRRREEAESNSVRIFVQKPNVSGTLDSLRRLWRAHSDNVVVRIALAVGALTILSLGAWTIYRLIRWLF
jgi:serine/threonine-protein kinase